MFSHFLLLNLDLVLTGCREIPDMILFADLYADNTELIQTAFTIFGLGIGAIFWAIIFCSSD